MNRILRISAVLLLAVAVLVACGPQEVKQPPDEVVVQLKWIHQAQFAGFYVADQKEFYAEENIDVTLQAGGSDVPVDTMFADVVNGETTFAISAGDQVLVGRAQGKPIVAIAVIFQKNPWAYATLKGSGIDRPQDLVGKKVMVPPQAEIQHQALLEKLGIDPDAMEIIPGEWDARPLISGEIDAHMVYRTGSGLLFWEAGYEVDFMWVDDYGLRLYGDTIVATEELIQQDPELVERFLRATLKGWRYAIENPAEALDLTLQYDATLGSERQARMMETQTPLIHTGEVNIGWMDRSVWHGMHQMLLDAGILAQPMNVAEVYTMQFLNEAYGEGE